MIGFDAENSGRRIQVFLFLDDRGGPGIGGHTHILEQHAPEEDRHVIGESIEVLAQSSRLGDPFKASVEIDGRPAHRLIAERLAIEPHMRELVVGDLFDELLDCLALELRGVAANDFAGIGTHVLCADALSSDCAKIILGFHVFEIESEPEDVLIGHLRRSKSGRGQHARDRACGRPQSDQSGSAGEKGRNCDDL